MEEAQDATAVPRRKGPLQLLDLPVDVLKEIVKEVTHTNDLTALALTHSALHNLAIPHIYSRFDIVWPDAHATSDPRTGVDALTYGLATLSMGDVLTEYGRNHSFTCMNCGMSSTIECNHSHTLHLPKGQRRLGNQYPQFTRKFSLGNGPEDWVQEYLITKESGKMLGTLVALAVARMINLETFIWDMPTGVLRDVWLALSSLPARHPSQECRLERVWVRWHDNSEGVPVPQAQGSNGSSSSATAGSMLTPIGWTIPPSSGLQTQTAPRTFTYAQSRVEYPTLSVLPPLKSLSVLDIDELDYLDEMSVLIARSKDILRELRVGIAATAVSRDFVTAWDGPDLYQVDHNASWPGASIIGDRRLGGVLGILLGRVFDIRKKEKPSVEKKKPSTPLPNSPPASIEPQPLNSHITMPSDIQNSNALQDYIPDTAAENTPIGNDLNEKEEPLVTEGVILNPGTTFSFDETLGLAGNTTFESTTYLASNVSEIEAIQLDINSLADLISAQDISTTTPPISIPPQISSEAPLRRSQAKSQKHPHVPDIPTKQRDRLEWKLKLQTLELERVPLSVAVLQKSLDWSVLTDLTMLDCPQHDRLWVMLRRHFQPSSIGSSHVSGKNATGTSMQYHLNLRKIHTDAASPSLITFLKETLAPNTLETLFLQDRRRPSSSTPVTIDAIYRGPLKRHRASLRKLMLDSSERIPRGPQTPPDNTRWRAWMPNRDVLNFITSGRMSGLRELGIAIDYKDWHHFLQRLPQIPHLRSLNIPFIADHVTPAFDPKELAMQVVDVIVLRPEVELCYMGISHKCFEILENRPHDDGHNTADLSSSLANGGPGGIVTDDEEASDDDGSEEEEDEEEEDGNGTAVVAQIDPDETESEASDHDDSDSDSSDGGSEDGRSKVRLRLREILFYDDKVAIFKARHGRL